ncbi:MAG: chemotaxis protein CheX [Sulfurospirillum sp.]|nr:chemotaxis protein CheX [Sulfurospirillum sp.]
MINAVDLALKNFCVQILGLENIQARYIGKNLYGAAIALCANEKEYQWYLLFQKETLNIFSKALLFDDDLSEDDLDDLCKEIANMIIGSAKVTLEQNENSHLHYTLGVPEFLGRIDNTNSLHLDDIFVYKIKNRTFLIGRKLEI